MRGKLAIFSILFILSRVFFANPLPVFFDSLEYLTRLGYFNFLQALTSGHIPLHAGYVFTFWPIHQLAENLSLNPGLIVIYFQSLLALLGLLSFYKIIEFIANKHVAFISLLIASFLPLFWITNVTIMMETTYLSYFLISLYFITRYLKLEKVLDVFFACLFFGLSFFTHFIILLWLPFIFYFIYLKKRKVTIRFGLYLFLTILFFSVFSGLLVGIALNQNPLNGLIKFYTDPLMARANLELSFKSIIVIFRNFLIPIFRNNTSLITILSFVSFVILFKKNMRLFLLCLLWIIPALITNQWWDSLFFGRHALIVSFCFSFLTALLISKRKIILILVFIYLAITVLPALYLLKLPIPYLEASKLAKRLLPNGIYIESHFARPQITNMYRGTTIFVEEPSWNRNLLTKQIDKALENNLPVFVSFQALSEPYGLYSGPYLHSLSLSYKNNYVLKTVLAKYSIRKFKTIDDKNNLGVFQIYKTDSPSYPKLPILKYSPKRLDYYDPLSFVLFMFSKKTGITF